MLFRSPGGRPFKYTAEELSQRIAIYLETNDKWTIAGLAAFLGVDRKTLYNYKENDELFHIIKDAINKIEACYEERLIYSNAPTGVIFALKNMGWKDKTEQDIKVEGGVNLVFEKTSHENNNG